MKNKLKGPVFLIAAAFFWGTTFVAQSISSKSVMPFTFNGIRMIIGAILLIPVMMVRGKGKVKNLAPERKDRKNVIIGGILCGIILFISANLQQLGMTLGTSAGKSGFITSMYVILVPVIGIFFGKKTTRTVWFSVMGAAVGLYLLCIADFSLSAKEMLTVFSMAPGDWVTLICALTFSFHIIVIDKFSATTDGVLLSFVQFVVAGTLGIIAMFIFESPTPEAIYEARLGIMYSALFSSCIAYTLQIIGQKTTPPATASILMCLESVFAVLSDVIILKTAMRPEEICGCVIMFVAIIASTFSDSKKAETV